LFNLHKTNALIKVMKQFKFIEASDRLIMDGELGHFSAGWLVEALYWDEWPEGDLLVKDFQLALIDLFPEICESNGLKADGDFLEITNRVILSVLKELGWNFDPDKINALLNSMGELLIAGSDKIQLNGKIDQNALETLRHIYARMDWPDEAIQIKDFHEALMAVCPRSAEKHGLTEMLVNGHFNPATQHVIIDLISMITGRQESSKIVIVFAFAGYQVEEENIIRETIWKAMRNR